MTKRFRKSAGAKIRDKTCSIVRIKQIGTKFWIISEQQKVF